MQTTLDTTHSAAGRQHPQRPLAIRHILVPLDFSGLSRQALLCAVPLARMFGAKISLVHVAQAPVLLRTTPDGGIVTPADTTGITGAARAHLDELADQLLPDELRRRTIVREGNAANEVVAVARALKVDLIVLSNTGRSGLKRVLLGSTAERIVRHAHCPVLTVRRQLDGPARRLLEVRRPMYPPQLPWRRVLVPLDFSFTSLRALGVAGAVAQGSHAQLLLLNVVEPNPYPTGLDGAVLVTPDADLEQEACRHLPEIAGRMVPKSLPVETLVRRGRAADVIVGVAEKKGVDLIVLSTHGHTGLERLFLGSVAEVVVRQAHCPVLVVRKSRAVPEITNDLLTTEPKTK